MTTTQKRFLVLACIAALSAIAGCRTPPSARPSLPASSTATAGPASTPGPAVDLPTPSLATPDPTYAPSQSTAPASAPASAVAPTTAATPSTPPPPTTPGVITLDPVEVTATRTDPVAAQLRQNRADDAREAAIARSNREGTVSGALNGWKIPFFNLGFTADRLAHGADRRAEILAHERIVLLALRDAKTKEERAALKADLRALRDLRRSIVAADPRPGPFGT